MSIGDALKPIPTEYKGTVFRSKSEAILARCFDLNRESWLYEPKLGGTNSDWLIPQHEWDFLISRNFSKWDSISYEVLIEYKPRRPTATYIENLRTKISDYFSGEREFLWRLQRSINPYDARSLFDLNKECLTKFGKHISEIDGFEKVCFPHFYFIVWGSPWSFFEAMPVFSGYGIGTEDVDYLAEFDDFKEIASVYFGLTDEVAQKAKSFRFDLP